MKFICTLTLTLILAATAVPAMAADYVTAPAPTSFRGLTWGTPVSDITDLSPVQKPGFEDTYFRRNEPMTLGKAEIVSVAYYFQKDKLFRVGVAFAGRVNQFFLKEMLMQTYGPGRGVGFRYGWMWPQFSIEINYDNDKNTGSLYYTYEGTLE
ncbi:MULTISPECIES: hypothetical protein [unclassified Pseudodesulfovibrio]|uniref:hypothetical protein n=1 Tax=unclassified Pseudodesulfovibrio TaxID=2661612 RepID=UPI000FEBFD35|nr:MULTISPECIES: hypothetical protein [unclassified Pseudodesulfovibrio]MCJ2165692.1 hypothetical protein [Pseudodesulfovibrio sp. S3-i]RWU02955.1 hypothetical protein DWB63_13715 [Pseudodesulfovibrio sp. S3]